MNSKILELASNLAHKQLLYVNDDILYEENDVYVDNGDGELIYGPEFQDCFNEWYEFYCDEITKIFKDE